MSAVLQAVPEAFVQALREMGLAGDEPLHGVPLTGGVSSDIWRIDTAAGALCVKRALPRLRVAADWRAPIERNLYEARWMRLAAAAV
ncbi:MAG TPA: aminoglycoside phosphotransferase family protein, partial [Rubrivivax sp.]|nr:aminoglycoside phosphotransferase family protein [Rubrivivax sp.]